MSRFGRSLRAGLAAGAAGTTALNATTYLDMAIRGRPSSSTPQELVAKVADEAGTPIPGDGAERENRLDGLGPLGGTLTGVGIGTVAGLLRLGTGRRRMSTLLGATALGAAAMAMANAPLKKFGISDPVDWSGGDWLADAIPHLAYGVVTYGCLRMANS
jgi:hypothetical protein